MVNENAYPLLYAKQAIQRSDRILEAGCGNGRVLRALHDQGFDVVGCDYVSESVGLIRNVDPAIRVDVADVRSMPYESATFDAVLAFGVIHGLATGVGSALDEFHRVLRPGGTLVVSVRADNFNTRVSDIIWRVKSKDTRTQEFHKFNLTRAELLELIGAHGFAVSRIEAVTNVPLLYRVPWLRQSVDFNEQVSRQVGYRLNWAGQRLTDVAERVAPHQLHSLWVACAHKISE